MLTLEKRKALVRCARKYDALIITDDVYDHLQWRTNDSALDASVTSSPLQSALMPRLVDVDATLEGGFDRLGADGFGNTMSNGSFSKIVGPGVRCGWAEGSPKLVFGVSQVGSSRSGGCPSQMTSTFLHKLVTSGWLQNNIATVLQPEYSTRYQIMVEALQKYAIPLGCSMIVPGQYMGGYFIWLKLPPGTDGDELTALCKTEQDLLIVPGRAFEVPCASRISHAGYVRLCFSWEEKPYIKEGIRRLAAALKKMLGNTT